MMKVPITREGYENLKKDHEYLLNVKRPQILDLIEEARGHGDLSENAEYDAAKEAFQFLQKKVAEIEEMIKSSEIIDTKIGKRRCSCLWLQCYPHKSRYR